MIVNNKKVSYIIMSLLDLKAAEKSIVAFTELLNFNNLILAKSFSSLFNTKYLFSYF